MKKETISKIIAGIIIVILLIILGIVGNILYNTYKDYEADKNYQELNSKVSLEETTPKEKVIDNPIDFKSLQKTNKEVFAWLYVPGTKVDYPLLQSEERDDYYLHKDIYGNYSYSGSIYAEYCNRTEMTDRVTVLYGHNMINGSMFATLHKFEDEDFFEKHKYFYIYTPERKLTYEIVSAHNYDDRHIMNSFNFSENKVFKDYLKMIQNPRSSVKNVRKTLDHKLTVKDRVVTLSTCLNSGQGRFLVQGVLIKNELTE